MSTDPNPSLHMPPPAFDLPGGKRIVLGADGRAARIHASEQIPAGHDERMDKVVIPDELIDGLAEKVRAELEALDVTEVLAKAGEEVAKMFSPPPPPNRAQRRAAARQGRHKGHERRGRS